MPNTRSCAPISFFVFPISSTICTPPPCSIRHYRFSQPSCSRRQARRPCRAVRVRSFGPSGHRGLAILELRSIRLDARSDSSPVSGISWGGLGGKRDGETACRTRLRRDVRSQWRCRSGRSSQPAQRRSGCHQRYSFRPDSSVRLRSPALGRAPASECREHDSCRRSRFPPGRERDWSEAESNCLPTRPGQRSFDRGKRGFHRRSCRHSHVRRSRLFSRAECRNTLIEAGFWEGHEFTAYGKTSVSYQGIALAIPQGIRNQTPL